ncbi:hypothetical protein H9P43_002372 [Blastocladiella emersonii ATCC 22665]|nr:hypothetical protein H9P43_002372 [Blastocladiella emersonii ATCC 22665]
MYLKLDNATKAPLFANVSFELDASLTPAVVAVMGPSGTGSPADLGTTQWRTRAMYVPQRPPLMRSTPAEFFAEVTRYGAQAARRERHQDPVDLAEQWNVPAALWQKPFTELSGGEAQRIMLAIGVALNPDLLLLDEPTSALDPDSTLLVEETLRAHGSCLWVTHSEEQAARVATHILRLDKASSAPPSFASTSGSRRGSSPE